jgi:3-oxoacyl-(acyl-carrier-protein) synthase
MEWSLKGPHENSAASAAASGLALVEAFDLIRGAQADLIAAGGTEALSATRLRASGSGPRTPPGEAGATVILEGEASVTERGAQTLGRLLGCGLAPRAEEAVSAALAEAGLAPAALAAAYVNGQADSALHGLPASAVIRPEALCGDVQGATSALHTALALLARHDGPVLILTVEQALCVALVISRV